MLDEASHLSCYHTQKIGKESAREALKILILLKETTSFIASHQNLFRELLKSLGTLRNKDGSKDDGSWEKILFLTLVFPVLDHR